MPSPQPSPQRLEVGSAFHHIRPRRGTVKWVMETATHEPEKTCTKCGVAKLRAEFSKHKSMKDGAQSQCKVCAATYYAANREAVLQCNATYYAANREKLAAQKAVFYVENREAVLRKHATYRQANPTKHRECNAKWAKANRGRCNAKAAAYRAARRQATPPLLSAEERNSMAALYQLARDSVEILGGVVHVDHIIPLNGDLVSGLHVRANLRLLDGPENMSKGKEFNPMTYVHILPDGMR